MAKEILLIRVEPDFKRALFSIAKTRGVSVTDLVRPVLERSLSEMEGQEAFSFDSGPEGGAPRAAGAGGVPPSEDAALISGHILARKSAPLGHAGAVLLAWRKGQKLTQKDAAGRLGVNAATYASWEQGRRSAPPEILSMIAQG